MDYRDLLAWLRTDPARVLVSALYFGLFRTRDARSSINAPVWWRDERCERALPARALAVAEASGLCRMRAAADATGELVAFWFFTVAGWFDVAASIPLQRTYDAT